MRVLVTGASGFIGRHVAAALSARGDQVTALVRGTTQSWKTHWLEARGIEAAYGDVTDVGSLVAPMKGMDAVVHCAAFVRLGAVDEALMERVNVTGTENVMQVARDQGVGRVLHTSSIAALGIHGDGTVDERAEHPGDYGSTYERTKHVSTLIADDHARRGLDVVQVMPSVVFGRRDPNFGVFFKRFVRRRLHILPAPETVISLAHVEDLARGFVAALDQGRRGERFLFTQANVTFRDLFAHIERATGIRGPRIVVPTRLARASVWTAGMLAKPTPWRDKVSPDTGRILGKTRTYDATRAKERLGWEPADFDARLDDTARWYAHYYGPDRSGPPPIGPDGVDLATLPGDTPSEA